MIRDIRNPLLRKTAVVATIVGTVIIMLPVWLHWAIRDNLERDFGEDIRRAWRGH